MKEQTPMVTFTLSLEEANKIFKALSNLPFAEVYELIGKLNEQANNQLSKTNKSSGKSIHIESMDLDQLIK
jgi:hypothetical protein